MSRRRLLLACLMLAASCKSGPSRAEALRALTLADPGVDTATKIVRVWTDGPPWFSCAEVLAKLKGSVDHAVVRDQLANWRPLILAERITLRDTAAGVVSDPGWCVAHLRSDSSGARAGWRIALGDSIPSGGPRRGWDVSAGHTRVNVVRNPTRIGKDSARADYYFTVQSDANGLALGADRDTVRRSAMLERVDGEWRFIRWNTAR